MPPELCDQISNFQSDQINVTDLSATRLAIRTAQHDVELYGLVSALFGDGDRDQGRCDGAGEIAAFERQLSGRFGHLGRPSLAIDARASAVPLARRCR